MKLRPLLLIAALGLAALAHASSWLTVLTARPPAGTPAINLPAGINQLTLSASGSVKLYGGSLSLVECTSGTSVQLQIYDNGYSNTGSAVYSVTLSSGQSATPTFHTINGMYAVITGTGTFRLTINND